MQTRSLFLWPGLALVALLLCVSGCQKAPSITLESAPNLVVEAGGGAATLSFTANRDWTVRADPWIHVSPASGTASNKPVSVTVTADPNKTPADRTGTVTIVLEEMSQSVTIRQEAVYFRFLLDDQPAPSALMLDKNGVGPRIIVETNVTTDPNTWSVTCSEPWCYHTAGSYPSNYIMLSGEVYGKNDPLWPRSCELHVVIPGFYDGTFKVVQESLTFIELSGAAAEEYILSPSGATMEFFIYTNLYNWKIENGNDWIKAEKVDAMTLRVRAVPRTQASSMARKGTIHLYSASLPEKPSTAGDFITLNFKEGDPDMSGEDYGYGDGHGWD